MSTDSNRPARLEGLAVAAILLTALALRLTHLDQFIASDEVRWTCRTVNFARALREGDLAGTFQVGHPGVLTMWAGAAALPYSQLGPWWELCRITDGGRDFSMLDERGEERAVASLGPILFAARRGVAVATVGLLALVYLLLRKALRLGAAGSLAALGLLAFDPFLIAHSRVLHVDGLVSLTSLAAVLALVATAGRAPARLLVGAGALAGLALLAKSSALVLAGLAMIVIAFRTRHPRRAARELAAWSLGAALAGAVLWPAVWVAPGATVSGVLSKAAEEGGAPHSGGNFFLGREVEDPGPLFYPVAEAFRLTPVTTLAALAAIGLAARLARRRRDPGGEGGAVIGFLLVWAALFSLALTLGPKKFDRYALPALVALDVAGGLAIARVAPAGVLAGAVALQLAAAARAGPYGLAYYNPLLGGAPAAVKTILVGWGEGYDLAATWLNRQPHAENLEVSVPGWSNFAPLFAGHTRSAPGYRPGRTDYAVLYVSKVQRRRYESLLEEYHDRGTATPAFVGSLAGIPYVWIYANNTVGPLRDYLGANARPGDVIAADGESVLAKSYSGRARLVETWGHWGETEMREAVASAFPPAWARAWVVRYPGYDPEAPLSVLAEVATRGPTVRLAGGAVEVTRFDRAGAAP